MDVQTLPASVPTDGPFTMADANQIAAQAAPVADPVTETTTTEGQQPTKAEEPASPAPTEEESPEPPFLKAEDSVEDKDELNLEDLNLDETLKGLTPEEQKNARKGVEKIVSKAKSERDKYEQQNARLEPIMSYLDAFGDPAQWQAAYEDLGSQLAKMHGQFVKPTAKEDSPQTQAQGPAGEDEDALWQTETYAQTKARWMTEIAGTVDTKINSAVERLEKALEEKLGPVENWHKKVSAQEASMQKVDQSYPSIHGHYPFATKEMLTKAVSQFPDLEPMTAFRAVFADEIGRQGMEWAKKLNQKPAGPRVGSTNTQVVTGDAPATTMAGIYQELGLQVE